MAKNKEETLNELILWLMRDIRNMERVWLNTEEFSDLTRNEMRIIFRVGEGDPKKMSELADAMGVSKATMTCSMNLLARKGYVYTERTKEDKRVVIAKLTEAGEAAFETVKGFYRDMIAYMTKNMKTDEVEVLINTLAKLRDHYNIHSKLDKVVDHMLLEE